MRIVALLAVISLSTLSFGADTTTSDILHPPVDKTLPLLTTLPTIHCDFADYGCKKPVPIHVGNDD